MSNEPTQHKINILNVVQVIFTLLIAVGGLYLNMKQNEMSQKIESIKATSIFAETFFKYIDKVELDQFSKKEIIVSLLAIITEASLSVTGEIPEEKKQNLLQLMPLHFALVSQNPGMLAHFGADVDKRRLWVPFALNSANMKIKITAMQALEYMGKYGNEAALLPYAVENILLLCRKGRIRELVPSAVSSLSNLLEFVDTEVIENEQAKETITLALYALQDISSKLTVEEDPQSDSKKDWGRKGTRDT